MSGATLGHEAWTIEPIAEESAMYPMTQTFARAEEAYHRERMRAYFARPQPRRRGRRSRIRTTSSHRVDDA